MIVKVHRVKREGRKDKIWWEVKFDSREWAIMIIASAFICLGLVASNGTSAQYKGYLIGAVAGAYLILGIFVYIVWFFVSMWVIYQARKKGTTIKEVS